MHSKVLVLGASGYLGSRVTERLSHSRYEVTALVRRPAASAHIRPFSEKFVVADVVRDWAKLRQEMKKYPLAVSCIGEVAYGKGIDASRRANVRTTECILKSLSGWKGRLVFIGSAASRGFSDDRSVIMSEDDGFKHYKAGLSAYCDSKHEAEALVRDSGIDAVIVEPGSLVGAAFPGTHTTNTSLTRKILSGLPVLPGGASYTSVHCAAKGIVSALEHGKRGQTYLLGGENISMLEFSVLVRRLAGKKMPGIVLPRWAAAWLGKRNLIINEEQALLGSSWSFLDSGRARQEISYTHTMQDLEKAISETILSLKQED